MSVLFLWLFCILIVIIFWKMNSTDKRTFKHIPESRCNKSDLLIINGAVLVHDSKCNLNDWVSTSWKRVVRGQKERIEIDISKLNVNNENMFEW